VTYSDQKIMNLKEATPNRYYAFYKNKWVYFNNNIPVILKNEKIIKKLENKFQHTQL